MRQAIHTEFRGPTATGFRPRYIARGGGKRITLNQIGKLGPEGNHVEVARRLARELEWRGEWIGGSLPDGSYAFTQKDDREENRNGVFTV